MEQALKDFEQSNPAFGQFVGGYELANADRETRRNFSFWRKEEMLQAEELRMQVEEGKAEGRAEGEARGRAEVAKNLLSIGLPLDHNTGVSGLTRPQIESLR